MSNDSVTTPGAGTGNGAANEGDPFDKICTAKGCSSTVGPQFEDTFPAGTTYAMIQGYVFEGCWRDHCWSAQPYLGVPHVFGEAIAPVGPPEDFFPATWPAVWFGLAEYPDGKFTLLTTWVSQFPGEFERVEGDSYGYSVREGGQDNEILGQDVTVRWETYNPNPGCSPEVDPDPLLCERAVIVAE